MDPAFQTSRRDFFKGISATGLTVVFNKLAVAAQPPSKSWSDQPGHARYRIEGVEKVTGQKIYARDFRARDIRGWPQHERVATILRVTDVTRLFTGINLSMLPGALQPLQVVTGEMLAADGIVPPYGTSSPPEWPSGLLVSKGQRATFYGQPAAILIFADFETWRQAKQILQFNPAVLTYGDAAPVQVVAAPYSPPTYLPRYADGGDEKFSQVLNGESDPYAKSPNSVDRQAIEYRGLIDRVFTRSAEQSVSGSYSTQILDPMFMEPEAGLAWLDRGTQTLHLVLGTQATNGDLSDTFGLFACDGCPIAVKTVVLNSCYPGGGFGGRDASPFPALLALAAAYAAPFAGLPVRIAQDRYEQFQSGLKQLDSHVTQRIAFDPNGRFLALESKIQMNGGGINNYSQLVAELAGYCAASGYRIDKIAVDAVATPTPAVIAGSMRGFGGPQASFAVETLVDEVADTLKIDPIELRERNVLREGDRTVTGAPLRQSLRLDQICRQARAHPLWRDRTAVAELHARNGLRYGVGFALANQAYGTGTDGVMAEVSIGPDGALAVRSNCVDMGNGSATTLALATADWTGANAARIEMGDAASFIAPLGFRQTKGTHWDDPYWTASFSMSSSACITAFQQVHVVEQASRVLFETGLLPAAASIWGVTVASVRGKTQWRNASLEVPSQPGLPPLTPAVLATALYKAKLPASAMTHAVFQSQWVVADYTVGDWAATLSLDGLSTQRAGSNDWQRHDRRNTQPPPDDATRYGRSLFTPSGALAAVRIDTKTGVAQVIAMQTFLNAGRVLQWDLLEGQSQGSVAMGIGYALLENLPLLQDGPGNGQWNLNNYRVALAADMPLKHLGLTILPTEETTARGIAEAVLCPIAPAIANAVSAATGHRFRDLPITPAQIREALR